MKRIITIITIAITSSILSSCNQYTPANDNNFVMMRANDIQFKQDVVDRQKYMKKPSHFLDLKRFFREIFSTDQSKPIYPSK